MEKNEFTTFDAARICKVKYQRLREWIGRGQIIPSIDKAEGVGTKTKFSRSDLYLISLFKILMEKGFSRDGAKMMVQNTNHWFIAFKLAGNLSLMDHIILIKLRVPAGFLRGVFPVSDEDFKKKPLVELLTQGGHLTDAFEYISFVVVNFKKIRAEIDAGITD